MKKRTVFSERLYKVMFNLDVTPKVLSEASGVHYNTVLGYLNNGVEPTATKLVAICEALDTSADYLLGLTDLYRSVEIYR